ncbi:MAG: pantetheine-phosphate adenylyltransferase [Lentisphaerae bacterium GWF2_44_16]|nr:MAG: pantetheine-phosphate adenylyltransferase [Lentisphaerae bacterium GWF2_44_16]
MKAVLYPGSFDPVTNGHLDVIKRACRLFDKVIVGVAVNAEKSPLFTTEERLEMLKSVCRNIGNVEILSFKGLLLNAVTEFNAAAVIRGLRAVSDFEYEFQMALMNRELNSECETIFMMPSPEYSFTSSRLMKEIARCGGDISAFIPPVVVEALKRKLNRQTP